MTLFDDCVETVLDPRDQTIAPMKFTIAKIANPPSTATFLPFADLIGLQYKNLTACGARKYVIAESYPFVTIERPLDTSDSKWTIKVATTKVRDVGEYTATLKCSLVNYPTVQPATIQFKITIDQA